MDEAHVEPTRCVYSSPVGMGQYWQVSSECALSLVQFTKGMRMNRDYCVLTCDV